MLPTADYKEHSPLPITFPEMKLIELDLRPYQDLQTKSSARIFRAPVLVAMAENLSIFIVLGG